MKNTTKHSMEESRVLPRKYMEVYTVPSFGFVSDASRLFHNCPVSVQQVQQMQQELRAKDHLR